MKTLKTIALALALTTLAACGGDSLAPKLDPRDLTNPVVITGGSPDVRSAAEAAITKAGFVPSVITDPNSTEPAGTVIKQSPSAGTTQPAGTEITIVVSAAPTEEPTPTETPTP